MMRAQAGITAAVTVMLVLVSLQRILAEGMTAAGGKVLEIDLWYIPLGHE